MSDYKQIYNEAIRLIQTEQYTRAEELLNQLLKQHPTHSLVNWALGLLEAVTGKPYIALKRWEHVSIEDVPFIEAEVQKLRASLPVYESIFANYHLALTRAKERDFSTVVQMYEKMIEEGKNLPLPVEIYHGYFLSLLITNRDADFWQAYKEAPVFVKRYPDIESLYLNSMVPQKLNVTKRSRFGWLIGANVAIVALIFMSIFYFQKETEPVVQYVEIVDEEKLSSLETEIEQLTLENKSMQSNVSAESQKNEEFLQLVEASDLNLELIEEQAAQNLYRQGYQNYQRQVYSEAIDFFIQSLKYRQTTYFSDDAHFFLIQSLLRTNNIDQARQEMDLFLSNTHPVYKQSPYLDDIMLLRIDQYVQEGKERKANELLGVMKEQFSGEWTVHEVERLLARKATEDE